MGHNELTASWLLVMSSGLIDKEISRVPCLLEHEEPIRSLLSSWHERCDLPPVLSDRCVLSSLVQESAREVDAMKSACGALELGQRFRVTMREHTQQQLMRQREQRALLFVERSIHGLDKDLQLVP